MSRCNRPERRRVVFETPSSIPEPAALAPSRARQAEIDESLRRGKEKRLGFARWAPGERRRAIEQERFEESHAGAIEQVIAEHLEGFKGAETPGSARDKEIRKRIRRAGGRMLRASLLDRLRDFQICNNYHVRSQPGRASCVDGSH